MSAEDQGKTFAEFVRRELEAERERRKTLDGRGVTIITTSGTLAALIAAVGAFATGRPGFRLPDAAAGPLKLTLVMFAAAGVFGIISTRLTLYAVTPPHVLREMLGDRWNTDEVDARNFVSEQDVKTIESLRSGNNEKAGWLIAALVTQVVGLVALTYAVYEVLGRAG